MCQAAIPSSMQDAQILISCGRVESRMSIPVNAVMKPRKVIVSPEPVVEPIIQHFS